MIPDKLIAGEKMIGTMKMRIVIAVMLLGFTGIPAVAQIIPGVPPKPSTAPRPSTPPEPMVVSLVDQFSPLIFSISGIPGAPYSAVQVRESTQLLSDGTQGDRLVQTTVLYRDSEGRTRTERPFPHDPRIVQTAPLIVEIEDPVANCRYVLDVSNLVAHRTVAPPPQLPRAKSFRSRTVSGAEQPNGSQSLGSQMIEGVLAEGQLTRTIHTDGEGQESVWTSEVWRSPELKEIVLNRLLRPGSEQTTRLTQVKLGEPDPALFQVPPGYKIVDETGPFTLTVTVPGTPPKIKH